METNAITANVLPFKHQHRMEIQFYGALNYEQCLQSLTQRILIPFSAFINSTEPKPIDVDHASLTETLIKFISDKFNTSVVEIETEITQRLQQHLCSNDDQATDPTPSLPHNIIQFPQRN